jgi:hypothetical protein
MIKRLPGNGDAEPVHRREVGGGEIAGLMDLPEDDGLTRSVGGPPLSHATLEGAAMGVKELSRMRLPEPVEERLGAEPRLGAELFLDFGPNGGKRVRSRAIGPR